MNENQRTTWIENIPNGWTVYKAKAIFHNVSVRNHGDAQVLSLYRDHGVVPKDSRDDNHNVTSLDTDSYKYVEIGDLVINKMKAWQGSLAISSFEGIVSPAYYVCKTDYSLVDQRFIHHYLRNQGIISEYQKHSAGMRIGQWDLNIDDFLRFELCIPTLEEQKRISVFLDKKLSQIDALLANEEEQIEKLKQYKRNIIAEAITKGLDKTVPIIDCGIEWIGDVAENHSLIRLKFLADILDQYRQPITADQRNQDAEVLYDYYGASGIIDKIDGYTIDDHVMLIGEDGANLRLRNLPLMYEVNGKAWINNHAHILKPKENIDFYYLFYALEGLDLNPYITGSAQPKLSQENLKNIIIPIPDLIAQSRIVNYLKDKLATVDQLIVTKHKKIELITDYKKSLIYEYVTGKSVIKD